MIFTTNEAFGYKPHPIFFSDDDIYINYEKWKSGENTSLLITALSGSGKSTIAKKIAEKFNAYYVEIDIISFGILRPHNANWEYIKEHDKYLYKYFKENNIPPTIMQQFKNYQDIKKNSIIDKYIYWLCFERDDIDTNRVVIEGGDVAIALSHIEELSDLPILIKGTSLTKSIFRRMYRTVETKDSGLYKTIKNIFDGTYLSQYSKMYQEVNAARRAVMNQEYDELQEGFLPDLTFYHGSDRKFSKLEPNCFDAGELEVVNSLGFLGESVFNNTNNIPTFTHAELMSSYDKAPVLETHLLKVPYKSGNITQYIPGSYFDEDTRVWMRKPNKEELQRLNETSIEFKPLLEEKPTWDPKLWRDPGPNIINFNIQKELKTFMYPQAIKEKYKGPNLYINLPGLSKDKRFRVRCEMIILDPEGRVLVDRGRTFKRMGLSMEFPGGGIDSGETILDAAAREAEEEARVIIKDAIDTNLWYAYEVPEDSKRKYGFWGVASFICVAKYKKKYKGYIRVDDRDSFVDRAEWVKPEDMKDLLPIHKQAIEMYKKFYLQESLGINMEFLNNEYD